MSLDTGETKIFVYGTLMNDSTVRSVSGEKVNVFDSNAILDDYFKHGLNIGKHAGSQVHGRVLLVSTAAKTGLDRYEDLGNMYREIEVTPRGYAEPVWAYQLIGTDDKEE